MVLAAAEGLCYLNDLDRAVQEGTMLRVARSAACAMGARISAEGKHFGALIVMSDKHDIHPDFHGGVLRFLASRIGENLYRRGMHSSMLRGLTREIRSVQHRMHGLTQSIGRMVRGEATEHWLDEQLARLNELSSFNAQLLEATFELASPNWFVSSRNWFKVYDTVELVRAALGQVDKIRNTVDPHLKVEAPRSLLTACLFKLLRYAPRRHSVSFVIDGSVITDDACGGPALRMVLWPEEPWISLAEANDLLKGETRAIGNSPIDRAVRKRSTTSTGYHLARGFMERYRLEDGRSASLDAQSGPESRYAQFLLSVPVGGWSGTHYSG
jgi:hypothetical protein